ncbi:MAG: helix-turn-helix domain-containing protein [Kiritimatiellae bacterium]|nr:helix-turn-helix domain-containing protein [Kiritimatiellia bacterium]
MSTFRTASERRQIVPHWFKDVLHSIIYADCIQAYTAIRALALFLREETRIRRILALHAHGLNHTQIAARLKVSRYCVIRAMNRFAKHVGNEMLLRTHSSQFIADMLDMFLEKHHGENKNIRTAIAFLWGLTCTELGVLSA